MKRSVFVVVLLSLNLGLSQALSYKERVYQAYISNNMQDWRKVIDVMSVDVLNSKTDELSLELLNYQYGYVAWCVGNERDQEAENVMKSSDSIIEILESKSFKLSVINSYKSAFYGYKVGLSPYKAPFYGKKSIDCANKAIELDRNNPLGYQQIGNAYYYMPAVFGGSKDVAIENYEKAKVLMELDRIALKSDWNYLGLLVNIALAYKEMGKEERAEDILKFIIKMEPNFLWAKEELNKLVV